MLLEQGLILRRPAQVTNQNAIVGIALIVPEFPLGSNDNGRVAASRYGAMGGSLGRVTLGEN